MTSYSSSKEEMEVASTVQPFKEEPRTSNKDFDKDSKGQRRFLACGVKVKIRTKKIFTEKSSGSFTTSCFFSLTLQR